MTQPVKSTNPEDPTMGSDDEELHRESIRQLARKIWEALEAESEMEQSVSFNKNKRKNSF